MKYDTAKEFNENIPIHSAVIYTSLRGDKRQTTLKGCARVMTGGAIVAQVTGVFGEVDIARIELLTLVNVKQYGVVRTADDFNAIYPVGTTFNYYPFTDSEEYRVVTTVSTAWLIGREPVVSVSGMSGGVSIHRLEAVLNAQERLA
jgi:hypothetical protein